MTKWFKALNLGMQILAALESAQAGQPASLSVEWKGLWYTLRLTQDRT